MNILVNAIPLTNLKTGISRYVHSLYAELEKVSGVSAFYITNAGFSSQMPALAEPASWTRRTAWIWRLPDIVVTAVRSAYWLNYERRVRNRCAAHACDLYHETGFVPVAMQSTPVVYTLYDLSLMRYREEHPRERVWFFNLFFKRRLPYAAHIITISEFMRTEIINELQIRPERVTAIPLASDSAFFPRQPVDVAKMLDVRRLPKEYILFVGTLEPRKNLALLIKALTLTNSKIPLILAGWQGWGDKTWRQELSARGLDKRVFITGYVDEETLACLYSGALAFVYPSFYEGFGLPVLEAMACGCPVVCSRAASLPEVAGNAALLIDPANPADLARALERLLGDEQMRRDLRAQGAQRARAFTWEKTALQTREIFREISSTFRGKAG